MWGRSTKQRRAAVRRRPATSMVYDMRFDGHEFFCREIPASEYAKRIRARPGSRFVCELPRDGFLQKPPKGVC